MRASRTRHVSANSPQFYLTLFIVFMNPGHDNPLKLVTYCHRIPCPRPFTRPSLICAMHLKPLTKVAKSGGFQSNTRTPSYLSRAGPAHTDDRKLVVGHTSNNLLAASIPVASAVEIFVSSSQPIKFKSFCLPSPSQHCNIAALHPHSTLYYQ